MEAATGNRQRESSYGSVLPYSGQFSRFTPSSALDIFIVTVLFYGMLMLVRGTRADQVLRGVILLFIFFSIVAAAFHLTMVDYLLRNSPIVLLVAIPIIFQPELRRALDRSGEPAPSSITQ